MLNSKNTSPRKAPTLARILSRSMAVLSVVGFILIALVGIAYIPIHYSLIENQQQYNALKAAQVVDSFIQGKFSEMETTVKISNVVAATPEEQQRILENLLGLDRAIRQVSLYDAQVRELMTVSRLSQAASGQAIENIGNDVFVQSRQADRYISRVYVDKNTSEPLVVLAVPVKNVFGEYQGVLLSEVNLKFMWDLVAAFKVGEAGFAYVVDRQGNLLALRDTSRVLLHENLNQVAIVRTFIENTIAAGPVTIQRATGINGTQTVGTYIPLGEPDWAVVTEIPVFEAHRAGLQLGLLFLGVIVMMAVGSNLIAQTLSRQISVPITELTEVSQRISNGEMNLQAPEKGPREISSLAVSFNAMTTQLRQSLQGLTRRTRALETSQQVSRRLAEIFDERQLVVAVVNEVQSAFHYYHAHIYLFDESHQNLVMVGGTGDAGRTMLAQGHKIARGRGLVGRAADAGEVVLISDVSQAPEWLPNPLLPDTKAEIAVPIHLGETIYGVLDVQQNAVDGLSQEDAQLLEGIANQVAIALQNARSYAQARQEAEQEALINAISQKIQQAGSVETVLQITSRELVLGLGAKRSVVQVHNPQMMPKTPTL